MTAEPLPGGGETPPPAPAKAVYRAPLTGLETPEPVTRRPVMVMVNNHPAARPQSGLSQADLVYECLAEGEITRLVAIFQSRSFPDPIGPVRSIRPYFIELGKGFGALQVHAGGSPDGYAQLEREHIPELDEITNAGPSFWRESFRKAPHNLYTNLEKIGAGAERRGRRARGRRSRYFLLRMGAGKRCKLRRRRPVPGGMRKSPSCSAPIKSVTRMTRPAGRICARSTGTSTST
ncbi:DUF3048 domain-containing protein [Paenibacillus sp. P25]|nr:DUF3048 domain-containing protein [Paenibacillus sp. P25]